MAVISILQARGIVGDAEQNLRTLDAAAASASAAGSDILVTPELFASGYAPASVAFHEGAELRARISSIAAAHSIAVVASTVEHAETRRFISASLFSTDGEELTRYRKGNLFGSEEQSVFDLGQTPPEVIEVSGIRVALAICYDLEFPETARRAALAGAEALLVPTAVPSTGDLAGTLPGHSYNAEVISTLMVPVRALENGMYVAYANHAGPGFTGLSCIASPYGNTLAIAGPGDTALLTAEFSPAEVANARNVNAYLRELRR